MADQKRSITKEVNVSNLVLTAVLLFPVIISLIVMLIFASSYSGSTLRMETVASLKPMVNVEITESVWSIIAGRTTFENSDVYDLIGEVNENLANLIEQSNQTDHLELTVAQRTMSTLTGYVQQIETDMGAGLPIVTSEATLEEVRSVASLINNMLENHIMQEVEDVATTSARLGRVTLVSVVAELILLFFALVLSVKMRHRMSRSINEPIAQLAHFADLFASGDLQARAPSTDAEELSDLTDRVNFMADQVETLIAQNHREQENLQKAELRTLQAQINPHFLYNTLDTIIWQAETGHSNEVIQITQAMSDFFRISLSSGADWIPVSQEIKHLTGYLAIQKIRYRDILNYEIVIPDDMGTNYILKLLLQPLVENAIYHGIKFKRGGGKITVTGRKEADYLYFEVKDTGRGMDEERLSNVIESLENGREMPRAESLLDASSSSFGLHNVNQRIKLHYNQSDGLHINSTEEGTTVSFKVPAKQKGDVI